MRVTIDTVGVPAAEWLPPLLEALTSINVSWLRANPGAPSIYEGGVRYVREPIGSEVWRTLPIVLSSGWGDCEDLGCARAAELQVSGVRAVAVPRFVSRGFVGGRSTELIHIVVRLPGGREEDPSARLGMHGPG